MMSVNTLGRRRTKEQDTTSTSTETLSNTTTADKANVHAWISRASKILEISSRKRESEQKTSGGSELVTEGNTSKEAKRRSWRTLQLPVFSEHITDRFSLPRRRKQSRESVNNEAVIGGNVKCKDEVQCDTLRDDATSSKDIRNFTVKGKEDMNSQYESVKSSSVKKVQGSSVNILSREEAVALGLLFKKELTNPSGATIGTEDGHVTHCSGITMKPQVVVVEGMPTFVTAG
jgi:hypothetical protein